MFPGPGGLLFRSVPRNVGVFWFPPLGPAESTAQVFLGGGATLSGVGLMLVKDFIDLPMPLTEVEAALLTEGDLGVWAEGAYRMGERLAVGPSKVLAAPVSLEVGDPVHGSDSVRFPVRWEVPGAEWLFPHMEAELVLSELTPEITHIVLRGSYRPPLEEVGAALDRLAFHRIAEATVRHFLERLAGGVLEKAEGPDRSAGQ